MPLTKAQKAKQITDAVRELEQSKTLLFVDFAGTSVEELRKLRADLKSSDATMKIIKKRLLAIALKEAGIDFDPMQFTGQAGTIFGRGDISEVAGIVYRFAKGKERFAILGAYDIVNHLFLDAGAVAAIGKLPPRELILAQVVGVTSAPLRKLLYILNAYAEKLKAA
jgi:large subunit ribosomal protein L10